MKRQKTAPHEFYFGLMTVLVIALGLMCELPASAQPASPVASKNSTKDGARDGARDGSGQRNGPKTGRPEEAGVTASPETEKEYDQMSRDMIRRFSETYKIGPQDSIAIRVKGQPDYSVEKAKVSPTGTIYHPLLGDILIAGMTLEQAKKQLLTELGEFLVDPVVSVELLEAQSAKVGVLGDVKTPRVIIMTGPMTMLDAITEAGGFTDGARKSNVTLLRQNQTMTVNVKNVLEGKAKPGENIALQAGDTVIVHGGAFKVLPVLSTVTSFASLLSLLKIGAGTK